eukprot:CAMPEP_0114261016 /NCGR_PEP_ID=MMETSP0058-20121206/20861_1 /TAXON_ID=36894 /ORGANISM="Pyramimonas parkeae, CCMP726" /LENGTH=44 /DNA_ID= /DNA_START= /DNA_END= /DNA_ORIENTATION=
MAAHGSPVKGYIVTQVQGIHIGALLDQVLHRLWFEGSGAKNRIP